MVACGCFHILTLFVEHRRHFLVICSPLWFRSAQNGIKDKLRYFSGDVNLRRWNSFLGRVWKCLDDVQLLFIALNPNPGMCNYYCCLLGVGNWRKLIMGLAELLYSLGTSDVWNLLRKLSLMKKNIRTMWSMLDAVSLHLSYIQICERKLAACDVGEN